VWTRHLFQRNPETLLAPEMHEHDGPFTKLGMMREYRRALNIPGLESCRLQQILSRHARILMDAHELHLKKVSKCKYELSSSSHHHFDIFQQYKMAVVFYM
jgi:hypothetical protein